MAGASFPFNWIFSAPFSSAVFPFSAEKRWQQQMLFGMGIRRVHYINCWAECCRKGKRSCIHATSCPPWHIPAGTVNSAPFKKPWWDFPIVVVNLPWKTVMLFSQCSHLFGIQSFWLIIALFSPLSPAEELLELSGEFQLSSITFCTRCLTYHQRWTRLTESMFAVSEGMKHDKTVQRRQSPCGVTKRTTLFNYIYANVLKSSPSLYGCIREKTRSLVRPRRGCTRYCI